jgi:hypothetical protein
MGTALLILAIAGWAYAYDRIEVRPHVQPWTRMGEGRIKRRTARQNRRVTR